MVVGDGQRRAGGLELLPALVVGGLVDPGEHERLGGPAGGSAARPDQALYERMEADEAHYLTEAEAVARELGLTFSASGAASEPAGNFASRAAIAFAMIAGDSS